jgi:hypothetical protein
MILVTISVTAVVSMQVVQQRAEAMRWAVKHVNGQDGSGTLGQKGRETTL